MAKLKEPTITQVVEWKELAARISILKEQVMRAGLVQTARQMDRATRMVGYEIEAIMSDKWPITNLDFLEAP